MPKGDADSLPTFEAKLGCLDVCGIRFEHDLPDEFKDYVVLNEFPTDEELAPFLAAS